MGYLVMQAVLVFYLQNDCILSIIVLILWCRRLTNDYAKLQEIMVTLSSMSWTLFEVFQYQIMCCVFIVTVYR